MRKRCLMVGMTMLAAMAARGAEQTEKPAGAKTAEEAVEMLATAFEKHDAKLLAAVVDDSTETGKCLIEMAPTLMEVQDALGKFDQALTEKFGEKEKRNACRITFPNPAKGMKMLRAIAKEKKGKWGDDRVEIADPEASKPMVFVKNAKGVWHLRVPEDAHPNCKEEVEGTKMHLEALKTLSERMSANLKNYETPADCANACYKEMGNLMAEAVKVAAEKETTKLVVPKIEAPAAPAAAANRLVVEISAKGVASFEGKELTPAQLTAALKEAVKKDPKKNEIQLRANVDATYETVRPVIDAISAVGLGKINLIIHPK